MKKIICDICQRPIDVLEGNQYKFKTKQVGWCSGWQTIDICQYCLLPILEASKRAREKAKEETESEKNSI